MVLFMKLTLAIVAMFSYLFTLQPVNTPYNAEMAEKAVTAIAAVTDQLWEAETMSRIVRWESGLRKDVADCTVIGKQGERGLWQVKPRTSSEKTDLCSSDLCSSDLTKQARIALARIRESKRECERAGLRGADILGGACVRGNRYAAFRYGDGSKLRSFIEQE